VESQLKRGFFGYSRKSVTAVVNDREMSITKSTTEAKEATEQVAALGVELDQRRGEIADLQARNRDLELKLEDAAERFRAVERSGSTSTTEELTDVLHAAERALSRLTDGARKNAEKQLGETEQVHDALRQDIDRLAEWRARMAPLAETLPDSIQEVRKESSALSERLRQALAPANDALDALAARLSELAESPEPPPQMPAAVSEIISVGEATDGPLPELPDPMLGVYAGPSERAAPPNTD
jgi:chromosome segregation ATPase